MNIRKTTIFFATICITLIASAGFAASQECETDSDCSEGLECVVVGATSCAGAPPCPEGEDCPDPPECEPEEFKECVEAPITCETDADCPDFLRCVGGGPSVICTVSSDGEEDCEEVSEEEGLSCQFVQIDCATNSDCPTDFECTAIPSACPSIACPEGEECPEAECDEEERFACLPREIECETTSDCPAEWTCQSFETACTGEDSALIEENEPRDPEGDVEEVDCEEEEEAYSACIPPGFNGGAVGEDLAVAEDARANGNTDENDAAGVPSESSEESSGCSVTVGRSQNSALILLLAGMVLALRRRRT
jgi:MYXO-CTERM domain-containing protein